MFVVYLVPVWPSQHDSGPASVCLLSRSSSPPLRICLAPPATTNIHSDYRHVCHINSLSWQVKRSASLPWRHPSSCGTSLPVSWWRLWSRCSAASSNLFGPRPASSSSSPPSEEKNIQLISEKSAGISKNKTNTDRGRRKYIFSTSMISSRADFFFFSERESEAASFLLVDVAAATAAALRALAPRAELQGGKNNSVR